ncbi:uncharacterized protein LOC124543429 [Vanessa cardui]|uniref:uncharacterized protein LOC124543429 n=1 Tax=Vanessa cardui TaxID=171605 RepID=UPI001F1469C9|nr:uncharacterized protein LOC124543429 [Vanessa cardui]
MPTLFAISLFAMSSAYAISNKLNFYNVEVNRTSNDPLYMNNTIEENIHFHTLDYNNLSSIELYTNFVPFLLNISMKLLENVHENIKNNYELNIEDIKVIEAASGSNKLEYQSMLRENLNKMNRIKYTSPEVLLLDLTDFSNYLLQTLIENRLHKTSDNLLQPSKWYKNLLKYSILRQQMKIIINVIEVNICYKFSICVQKSDYKEYLIEWLRHLFNADNVKLRSFFHAISNLLYKNTFGIKTNAKFRQKIGNIWKSDSYYQRNLVDFLDETLSEYDVLKVVNDELRNYVILLKELFKVIDDNYQLNDSNERKLGHISKHFFLWIDNKNIQIKPVIKDVADNMRENVRIWPIDAQNKLDNIWTKIITLE